VADVAGCRVAQSVRGSSIELGRALLDCGIGIEAGVFTLADAGALLRAPWAERVHRILVEVIFEHDDVQAVSFARAIDEHVARLGRPRLWHGDARSNWAVVDAGIAVGRDVRVGLEDMVFDRDGTPAPSNHEQAAARLVLQPTHRSSACDVGTCQSIRSARETMIPSGPRT
jgi:hypothetical protein